MSAQANQDLPSQLSGVAERFGRPMVALVYGAGMASEAAKVLGELAQRSRNAQVLHAIKVLADAYNEIATAYAKQVGWTEGMLNECDSAIAQAFAGQLVGPDGKLLQ